MRVLALDLSSKAGWAVIENDSGNQLKASGVVVLGKSILSFAGYPWSYVAAAEEQAKALLKVIEETKPSVIVIEETNLGKNRYAQKFLEFLHLSVLKRMPVDVPVIYISSSAWRHALGLALTAEDRRNNGKLSKAKKHASIVGGKLDKKKLGIKGRINKKHLAVRYANATYGLNLKMKDNDVADAICLGTAYLAGAEHCDGE